MTKKELKNMAVNSFLKSGDVKGFKWSSLLKELKQYAPQFLSVLTSIIPSKKHQNQCAAIGMCTAIILKHTSSKMSLVQKIVSLILYAGHASKQVFSYYNIIGIFTTIINQSVQPPPEVKYLHVP